MNTGSIDWAHWGDVGIRVAIVVAVALIVRIIARRVIRRMTLTASRRRYEHVGPATGNMFGQRAGSKGMTPAMRDERVVAVLAASGASPEERAQTRSDTMSRSLCLLVDWVLFIIVLFSVLDAAGISLTPLLTSAGLSVILIGFGAQSLVKDLLAGIFLVVEGQYSIGDTIDTGGVRGVVQEIGARVTRLQSSDGEVWYVRHGDVSTLGNQSQGWLTMDVPITVEAGRDPDQVTAILRQVTDDIEHDPDWHDKMLRPPLVLGLTSFDTTQMVFTVRVTSPSQSGVEREVRARAVAALAGL